MEGITDPVNIKIVNLLKDAGSSGIYGEEIALLLDLQTSNLNDHLKELKEKELVIDILGDKWRAVHINAGDCSMEDVSEKESKESQERQQDDDSDDDGDDDGDDNVNYTEVDSDQQTLNSLRDGTVRIKGVKLGRLKKLNNTQLECFRLLHNWRGRCMKQNDVNAKSVAKTTQLMFIARVLPPTITQLERLFHKRRLPSLGWAAREDIAGFVAQALAKYPYPDRPDLNPNPNLKPISKVESYEKTLKRKSAKLSELKKKYTDQQIECYRLLCEWRRNMAKNGPTKQKQKSLLTITALRAISNKLPRTVNELQSLCKVHGKYADDLLKCVDQAIASFPNGPPPSPLLHQEQVNEPQLLEQP